MSVLNDFFLATDDELAAVETRSGPGQSLPMVDGKGVLDVELATLERILHGESIDDVDAVVDLIEDPVRQEPESALADADEGRLGSAADEWAATEEMLLGGWSRDEAAHILAQLHELCRRAQTEQRRVYRWVSL